MISLIKADMNLSAFSMLIEIFIKILTNLKHYTPFKRLIDIGAG